MEAAFSVTDLLMLTLLGTSFLELGDQRRQNGDQKATWRRETQSKEPVVLTDAIRRPVRQLLSDQQGPPFTHFFINSTGTCGARTVQALARYRGHSSRRGNAMVGKVWNSVRDIETMKRQVTDQ